VKQAGTVKKFEPVLRTLQSDGFVTDVTRLDGELSRAT
jgi:hypothetical protein